MSSTPNAILTAFRSVSNQMVTGFFISFFYNYQPQIINETNRFQLFVTLLVLIGGHIFVLQAVDSIKARRLFRVRTFWLTFLTITQTISVWAMIAIATRFMLEALPSALSLDGIVRLGVVVGIIAAVVAATTPMPTEEKSSKP